jgi:uncharacterized membrane protein YidH (DUF202 family)
VTSFDPESREPGLAAERTDLAWNRSGLSLLGCGAVILRGLGRAPYPPAHIVVGVCVLLLGALTWFLGAWYSRQRRTRSAKPTTTADLAPVTLGIVFVGLAAFVLSAVSPS